MPFFTALAIGLGVAGIGMNAIGQVKQGKAAKAAGKAQQEVMESEAQLAEYNADVAKLQAKDAVNRGVEQEGVYRQQIQQVIGRQRAGFAAGNVDVGTGSAVDVTADAAYIGEVDALTIRTNATREAWGFEVQKVDLLKRAQIARKGGVMAAAAGRAEATAHYIGAAGSIATGAGSLLAAKYGFGDSGGYNDTSYIRRDVARVASSGRR
jgi:hypothetical protein